MTNRGDLAYAILAFQDITKRQQTEQALDRRKKNIAVFLKMLVKAYFKLHPPDVILVQIPP